MKIRKQDKVYFWISFSLTLLSNGISFQGTRLLTRSGVHHHLALAADAAIPFLPWTIVIYLGCLVYWFFLYRRIAFLPRERADRFYCSNLLGKAISLPIFILFPTAMARPEVTGTTFWDSALRFLYAIDASDNLFPSIHCLIAWLCWAGVRGNKEVSLPWRVSAAVMAVLVCLSTLTVRQHVLPDVFAGILLGELCYALCGLSAVRNVYTRLVDRLMRLVGGGGQTER